jgi:predicted ATP-dependent endonuclease of OLD family
MSLPHKSGLSFTPTLDQFASTRSGTASTVLSGGNNSGKSLVLKYLKSTMGKTAYMVGTNRFYHVYHFSTAMRDPNQLEQFESQFNSNFRNEEYNYEQNYIDLNAIIVGLSNDQRAKLFELCGRLLGSRIALRKIDEGNDLSMRYIDIDGQNLSVASTGTRLLMTMLGICMDDRFKTLLIDEPELGLSPRIQRSLASFLHDPVERQTYFPHLKQVVLATHSAHFLKTTDLGSNFIVSKDAAHISLTQVDGIGAFHRLQFNLLGNSLDGLFLPSSILYVEGQTDQKFIERICGHQFAGRNVVVIRSGGDGELKKKLHSLQESLGGLNSSPLRSRVFVIVDSVHAAGLKAELTKIGLLPENFIAWQSNGIEFQYPPQILSEIFRCDIGIVSQLALAGDLVTLNGITHTKNELCDLVVARLHASTALVPEFENLLLARLTEAIDA